MGDAASRVYLIDDDDGIRRALSRLLTTAGFAVEGYADAEAFLLAHDPGVPGCAIVDLTLPGKDGFAIQEALETSRRPVIFLTGQGDIPASVRAMKAGAVDFLTKPVDADILLAAVDQALKTDAAGREAREARASFDKRLARLTLRERQVLDHVVAGQLNKQIASDLGIVEKTIKVHRGRMMKKMGVRTPAELARIVQQFKE